MGSKDLYKNFPETPGVYIMKDAKEQVLYIGKAGNLRRRVSSYFTRANDNRIEELVRQVEHIDYEETDSALTALMLEAQLIKKHSPPFNVREKDDKSFLFVGFTNEKYPRPLLIRGKDKARHKNIANWYGPFTSASQIRAALKHLRKIFPYSLHPPDKIGTYTRPCLDAQIGLCPGTCVEKEVNPREYRKTMGYLKQFFAGRRKQLVRDLHNEMEEAAKAQSFERAALCKRQIFALEHVRDIAFIAYPDPLSVADESLRIEGYDVAHISGDYAVGAMVVFNGDKPNSAEYRKFKIKMAMPQDDVGMLREVIHRRLGNNWPLPDLVLVDGGKGQVNVASATFDEAGLGVPIVGIAKGPKRQKNEFINYKQAEELNVSKKTLMHVRDEAHRFAQKYHKKLRRDSTL